MKRVLFVFLVVIGLIGIMFAGCTSEKTTSPVAAAGATATARQRGQAVSTLSDS